MNLLAEEGPGWWPDVDLIEHYDLKDYEDSKWETMLLGHKPDGQEGLIFPSVPYYVRKNGADGKGNYGKDLILSTFLRGIRVATESITAKPYKCCKCLA